jgi:nicotinate-nucleotide adenylyltransferase
VLAAAGKRLGVMGGMFDPVHEGHLELAQQVKQLCQLDEVLLIPCGSPVHRPRAIATPAARITMLELATRDTDWLHVDSRECLSNAPSYTYNTLRAIRSEQPSAILHLLLGLDAFLVFNTWYKWREIFDLAHIVVVARPGYVLSTDMLEPELRDELVKRKALNVDDCRQGPAGKILMLNVPTPAISSTEIREMLRKKRNTSQFLNDDVAAYIHAHQLYQ